MAWVAHPVPTTPLFSSACTFTHESKVLFSAFMRGSFQLPPKGISRASQLAGASAEWWKKCPKIGPASEHRPDPIAPDLIPPEALWLAMVVRRDRIRPHGGEIVWGRDSNQSAISARWSVLVVWRELVELLALQAKHDCFGMCSAFHAKHDCFEICN